MFLLIISVFVFLILACYFDLKTGEIPENLNLAFIFSGLFLSFYDGNIYDLHIPMLVNSVIGCCLFFAFGYAAYKASLLGGGDVLLLAGVGAGIANMGGMQFEENPLIAFIFNLGVASIIWGLIYSLFLTIKNKKIFSEFIEKMRFSFILLAVLNLAIVLLVFFNIRFEILILLAVEIFFLIMMYFKIMEKNMVYEIRTEKLNEEDILSEDLIIKEKNLKNKFLSKEEVEEIRKIKETVKIKSGIKYAPAILIAFIILVMYGNLIFYGIKFLAGYA